MPRRRLWPASSPSAPAMTWPRRSPRWTRPRPWTPACRSISAAWPWPGCFLARARPRADVRASGAAVGRDGVRAAVPDLGRTGQAPVSPLIPPPARLDPPAGAAALRGPGPQAIAPAGFPAEAERLRHWNPPFRNLIGTGATPAFDVQPDRLISERTSVVVGGTEFVLIPVRGGETPDALMVYLPATVLRFTGAVLLAYVC